MAQKQFKIGLSNTDKQNMAQDVYERLINMCFDTYNSANTYNEGDFVVYENPSDTFQLYKCLEDNVTGAWDSTKWQLATFQDLVDDIESAVAFVNNKANTDGNYPTMTVGFADNMTPYDESAGDDQDEPFSFQATGTANGTQSDFATGSAALMKEKQGHSVVVNQKMQEPHQTNVTYNSAIGGFNYVGGHKLLIIQSYSRQATPGDVDYQVWFNATVNPDYDINQRNQFVLWERTASQTIDVAFTTYANYTTLDWFDFRVIDLTQWFNGDIPQDLLDHPEHFFRYYQGSLAYNVGTLVNANGRYIKCIGRQQWDEVFGMTVEEANGSVNKIKVIPNATYYLYFPNDIANLYLYGYDVNGNKIKLGATEDYIRYSSKTTFTAPSNCVAIRFVISSAYGTTYNHDITISIYYDGESGYDQYYPYEVLTNNDTGTETLRSAGSVKDSKAPDGTITRKVGVVDLGTLDWNYNQNDGQWCFSVNANDIGIVSASYSLTYSNLICAKYVSTTWNNNRALSGYDKTIAQGGTFISIRDSAYTDAAAFKTAMSGVYLFYELAEPTTEQGTTYSENLVIDDFGSMDFGGANGVPQGCLIFYPVDYKAFVDTLYKYTDGTPSNIALKSDLTGLVEQEDLSSTVEVPNFWTADYKKLVRTGDVYTLNLGLTNVYTGSLSGETGVCNIPSISISNTIHFDKVKLANSTAKTLMLDGNTTVEQNGKLYINISWVNK